MKMMNEKTMESGRYAGYVKNINSDKHPGYMIKTFGCQMNESDSERIAGMLESMGYIAVDSAVKCSFIIFNTCCVRESAEQKLFGHLGEMKKFKTQNKDLVIALCGCMMQQEGMAGKIKKSYPYADIVFGTNSMYRLPRLLYNVLMGKKHETDVSIETGDIIEGIPVLRSGDIKAYIPIMHGCNNFCSYCIVPYVRGRERSRKPSDIVKEIEELAQNGIKEITLLGQNVNSYNGGISFAELLKQTGRCKGIERIRFMTSHPKDLSRDLLEAIRDTKKVCNHLHLPMQSGSNRILEAMNRNYSKEEYLEMLVMAREIVPGIGLSTDIIVGFPGEEEEDFLDTLDVVEKVKFDFAFTFIYSKRKGTPAAERTDEVPDHIKHERFNRLVKLQNTITLEHNRECIGNTEIVLLEGESKTTNGVLTGRTASNKIVNFIGEDGKPGGIAKVKITGARTWHLEGKLIGWKF